MAKKIYAKQPKIKFHAVSCVAHNKLCKTQDVDGYPTIKLFKEGSYIPEEHENFSSLTEETIFEKLGFDSEGKQLLTGKVHSVRVPPPSKRKEQQIKPKSKEQTTMKNIRGESHHKLKIEPKPIETKPDKIARVVPFHTHEASDAWHDAATSFEFSLKYNMYMANGPMPKKEQDAFLDWLELLQDTLPPQMNRTLELIKHLLGEYVQVGFCKLAGGV